MALSFTRTDGRLLLVHFLAIPCFILGGQQLQLIRWMPLVDVYQAGGMVAVERAASTNVAATVSSMYTGPLYAWALAILLGCLLSALVTWRRGASWLIPVLLLGVAIGSSRTHYDQSDAVYHGLAWLRGLVGPGYPSKVQLGAVGSLLILLGLIPFLLTWNRRMSSASSVAYS